MPCPFLSKGRKITDHAVAFASCDFALIAASPNVTDSVGIRPRTFSKIAPSPNLLNLPGLYGKTKETDTRNWATGLEILHLNQK